MGKTLDEIYQESVILRDIKDGKINNIRIVENAILIEGENISITLPVESLLQQKEIEDVSRLTDEDIEKYVYDDLLNDALGELGKLGVFIKESHPGHMRLGVPLVVFRGKDDIDMAIDTMADWIPTCLPTTMKTHPILDKFLYAAAVTDMKYAENGYGYTSSASEIFRNIYHMGLDSKCEGHYATRDGQARDIASGIGGYIGAAEPSYFSDLREMIIDKIEAIGLVNILYNKLIEDGLIEESKETISTEDKFEVIMQNGGEALKKYINSIIEDAKKIHDLTPDEIKKLGDEYRNPLVSLAISNHYLDGVEMFNWYPGHYSMGNIEQEKDLAISERARELVALQAESVELTGYSEALDEIENVELYEENLRELQARMISGLTEEKEGDIQIDDDLFASTDIGKRRNNQEDAVLLVKDGKIPGFKMMIVADGMGGEDSGEVASHKVVNKIKEWFEGLSDEEKARYYANISDIQPKVNDIINEASFEINQELFGRGGATIVCAIIGEHDTLITNVGDSRAYVVRNGKLEQVSRDDATVQELYEKGYIPTRDAMRFHYKSNEITEDVGDGRLENIHSRVLNNDDYDMVLLFSDGVTDCLSEEEIAVITRETDKSKLSQELVRRALDNYSVAPNEVKGNWDYYSYIPGGKDNTTAATYVKDEEQDKEDGEER